MLALSFVHVGGGKSFALDVTVLPTAGRSPRVGLCVTRCPFLLPVGDSPVLLAFSSTVCVGLCGARCLEHGVSSSRSASWGGTRLPRGSRLSHCRSPSPVSPSLFHALCMASVLTLPSPGSCACVVDPREKESLCLPQLSHLRR